MSTLRALQRIDRRFLYALLILVTLLPFFVPIQLPVKPSPQTQALYETIESLPPGSFVLVGVDWSASTRGENGPQTEVLVRHLMRRRLRFALLAFDPQSADFTQEIALGLAREYNYQETRDWVNWGYRVNSTIAIQNFLKAMIQDIPRTVATDIRGRPIAPMPVMQGIRSAQDIALLLVVSPSSTYNIYIQYVQGPGHLKMGLAPTSVMVPEAFTYLDSKQLIGMIPGLTGAQEYEQMLGVQGRGTRYGISASCAHLLILFLIAVGNIAMLLERWERARREGRP